MFVIVLYLTKRTCLKVEIKDGLKAPLKASFFIRS